jgi:hypothetical protein
VQEAWGDWGHSGDSLSDGEGVIYSPKACTNDMYKDDKHASDKHYIEKHTGDKHAKAKHYIEKHTNEDSDFRLPHTPDQRLPSPNSKATPGPAPRKALNYLPLARLMKAKERPKYLKPQTTLNKRPRKKA